MSAPAVVSWRAEMARLFQQYEQITPAELVDHARPVESPLHPKFEWDDSVAAEKFRLVQAGHLLRTWNVTVVRQELEVREWTLPRRDLPPEVEAFTVRAAHSVTLDGERTYVPFQRIVEEPALRAQVIADTKRMVRSLQEKVRVLGHIPSVARLIAAAQEVLDDPMDSAA